MTCSRLAHYLFKTFHDNFFLQIYKLELLHLRFSTEPTSLPYTSSPELLGLLGLLYLDYFTKNNSLELLYSHLRVKDFT